MAQVDNGALKIFCQWKTGFFHAADELSLKWIWSLNVTISRKVLADDTARCPRKETYDHSIDWSAGGYSALARVGFGGAVSNRRAKPFGQLPSAHRCLEDGFFCPGRCATRIHRHEALDHPACYGEWRNSLHHRNGDGHR